MCRGIQEKCSDETNIVQISLQVVKLSTYPLQEQASWVCQCDDHVVYRLEQDFKLTLQQQVCYTELPGSFCNRKVSLTESFGFLFRTLLNNGPPGWKA